MTFKKMIQKNKNYKEKLIATTDNILKEALTLSRSEKAQLIDKLISSLDKPDKEIDELWANEAEDKFPGNSSN